ncbi:MAG: hypothetical protein COB30_012875 [Ectothiorhodospiraceae bacterium]|nr:hypothetical protein [Ectothiorhodospiraceae bacterium]
MCKHIRVIYWAKNIQILLAVFILCACSTIDHNKAITNVNVLEQGKSSRDSAKFTDICKGFMLTDKQIIAFYTVAAEIPVETSSEKFGILPCYTSGTAYLYGTKYNWQIRSGGFGEFYTANHTILKLCGKACCKKVEGIC